MPQAQAFRAHLPLRPRISWPLRQPPALLTTAWVMSRRSPDRGSALSTGAGLSTLRRHSGGVYLDNDISSESSQEQRRCRVVQIMQQTCKSRERRQGIAQALHGTERLRLSQLTEGAMFALQQNANFVASRRERNHSIFVIFGLQGDVGDVGEESQVRAPCSSSAGVDLLP